MQSQRPEVLIAGGGIAGVEALLALRALAGDRFALTLVSPEPELTYRPLLVEEPFTLQPPQSHSLEGIAGEAGAGFRLAALESVDPDAGLARLDDGTEQTFAAAMICTGGRPRAAFSEGITFFDREGPAALRRLVDRIDSARGETDVRRLAFVVPGGVSWPLPLYELALAMHDSLEARGTARPEITIVTPEAGPLIMFGEPASEATAELLDVRGIEIRAGVRARESPDGGLRLTPGDERVEADEIIALPLIDGPAVSGLPHDERGFLPIDEHARVHDCPTVYAAGDGTNFPIKQGSLGAQMADAAAAHLAASLGADLEPAPFHPVLRGKLFVGSESLYLKHDLTGGAGEGEVSIDYLWWPPHKVSGRYLSKWLAGEDPGADLEPPERPLDVEVSLPVEWHTDPVALDPYGVLPSDGD